ncbi:chaplin [Streptomyces sp. CA-250714]|uniref:chaplin n=1 Tax=Streptomyces sp. CA-250714 TaxID=3240060 RepID=UPI003D8FAEE6
MRIRTAVAASGLAATAVLGGATTASADSGAQGGAAKSPGVLSGNVVQIPLHIPVQLCGNTVDIIALLNPAFGNTCVAR